MIHYKSQNGEVFAYEESDIQKAESISVLESALAEAKQLGDEAEIAKAQAALDAINPVFFKIRDNIAQCWVMTPKEIEAHVNPPQIITTESLKEEITALRWQKETGGLTLPSGVRVATGIDDQNRITSVIANAQIAGVEKVDFKAASGWVTVTVQELQAIAAAIAVHVQACFTAERVHHEAIDALAAKYKGEALKAALAAYDVQSGWPV